MRLLNSDIGYDDSNPNEAILNSRVYEDVEPTTDKQAKSKLLDYIKSDTKTLDFHRDSEVAAFYAGRCVFVTGASGFVGKCLVEKLLRSCPEIKRVYILMRPKRGVDVAERVAELTRSELFDRLRESCDGPRQLTKIVAIKGDITRDNFSISAEDIELLSSQVSIVFHSAATVKFIEPLRVAVENNVVSVDNLIGLVHQFKSLEALVHVSTAYSNCDRQLVDEVFYETPIKAEKLIDMARWMRPQVFEEIAPVLLGHRPNTYTYTKAVAESLLAERSKTMLPNIPIAMVRPSIVGGIWSQPICGWVDNFNGPTGVILSMMSGAIQAMLACPSYCADIVPVDIVANLIICTAWQVHGHHHGRKGMAKLLKSTRAPDTSQSPLINYTRSRPACPPDSDPSHTGSFSCDDSYELIDQHNHDETRNNISIFNCVSGTLNPVAWSDFAKYIKQIGLVYPCNNVMRWPGTLLLSNELMFNSFNFVNHTLVAYLFDLVLRLMGKKQMYVRIYDRLMKMIHTLKPFTTNQWLFKCTNVTHLYERLTPIDKEIFNFDIRQVRWDDYLRRYYIGSKIYALKDDPNQVVKARHKLNKIRISSRLIQLILILLAYYLLLSGTSIEQYALESFKQLLAGITGLSFASLPSLSSEEAVPASAAANVASVSASASSALLSALPCPRMLDNMTGTADYHQQHHQAPRNYLHLPLGTLQSDI